MKLVQRYASEVTAFVGVCHRLAARGFVTSYGGNCAWRLDKDIILITPTQMNKGAIEAGDVVFIDGKGDILEGERKPTGERPMYVNFFTSRPDVVSVVHCHPPYVCACAIAGDREMLMRPYYPETVTEVGPVPVVPYGEPLTQKLADAFSPLLPRYNSFIMENHGLVTMTRSDISWTLMTVELLESSAQSLLTALSVGPVRELTMESVRDLGNVMKTRDLPLFGAPGVNATLEGMFFDGMDR